MHTLQRRKQRILIALTLTAGMVLAEGVGGLLSGSIALLGDAAHLFADAMALMLSYLAIRARELPATAHRSFGFHRAEPLFALVNGLLLLGIAVYLLVESIVRFFEPTPVDPGIMLPVAVAGFVVNSIGIALLWPHHHNDLNVRAAFVHTVSDMLSSLGVIVSGAALAISGILLLDALTGGIIALLIVRSAWHLIAEASHVLLESSPRDIPLDEVMRALRSISGVHSVDDVHLWSISPDRPVLSARLLLDNVSVRDSQRILSAVRRVLQERFGITHVTLETFCDRDHLMACEYAHQKVIPQTLQTSKDVAPHPPTDTHHR